jgi:hypothetical protein
MRLFLEARRVRRAALFGASLLTAVAAPAQTTTPADLLAAYTAQAGTAASSERGQALFNRKFNRDFESCAACHGAVPTAKGKDLVSEKAMAALAPAVTPTRFTDRAKVEYRFKVNCKDVVGRECTAAEKADLLAWLISLKP